MQKPAAVDGIRIMRWQENGKDHRIPSVFHSAWLSPAGDFALALANWTNDPQEVMVQDERLGQSLIQVIAAENIETLNRSVQAGKIRVTLPALSCALLIRES